MSTTQSTKKTLEALKTTLAVRPPYCSGTCPIPVEELALYYGRDENARFVHRIDDLLTMRLTSRLPMYFPATLTSPT